MKKIIAISVLFIYTLLSLVSYVGIHYCHGHIQSVAINTHQHSGCCDTEKSTCCNSCEDVAFVIDFDLDQNKIEPNQQIQVSVLQLLYSLEIQQNQILPPKVVFSKREKAPPNIPLPDLYLLNSSFLFYG